MLVEADVDLVAVGLCHLDLVGGAVLAVALALVDLAAAVSRPAPAFDAGRACCRSARRSCRLRRPAAGGAGERSAARARRRQGGDRDDECLLDHGAIVAPAQMRWTVSGMRVLIVEDEVKLAGLIRRGLREEGLLADVAVKGEDALWMAGATEYDAIVLDVMLPGIDGFEVCRRLRADGVWTPVLMLTARDAVEDRVAGLDSGRRRLPGQAVRVRRAARAAARARPPRAGRAARPCSRPATCALDPAARRVWRGDTEIELSAKEFALLETFMRRPGEVLTASSCSSTRGTTTTRTARTSSTCTSATCARRSTGRSASSRWRPSAAPATGSAPTAALG